MELSKENSLAHRNLGVAYYFQERYAEAAASFQRSLEIEPNAELYGNLGTLYFFQGFYAQAAMAFESAVDLGPNNPVNWRNLGDANRQLPDHDAEARTAYARALQLFDERLARDPDDVALVAERMLCLARLGRTDEAEAEADRIAALADNTPETLYRLVLAYEAIGRRTEALDQLERALRAGYGPEEIRSDPELVSLRRDARYHRLLVRLEETAEAPR